MLSIVLSNILIILFLSGFNLSAEESSDPSSGTTSNESEKKKDDAKDSKNQNTEESTQKNQDAQNYFYNKSLFKLSPFTIPIFKNGDVESTIQLECAMQATEDNWDKLRFKVPLLYHHIFVDLYQSLNFLWDHSETPSPEILKKRITIVANKILGEGKIKNVLIGAITITPRNQTS